MSNLEKQLAEATSHEQIDALLHDGPSHTRTPRSEAPTTAAEQTAFNKRIAEANTREELDAILAETREAAVTPVQPTTFTRTETIGGKPLTFSAASELELERAVASAYKAAELAPATPAPAEPEPYQAEREALAAQLRQADLELKFKRNEITTQEYLEQSGAVKNYLEKEGIPLDDLRATVEEKSHQRFEQSWADATTEFLHSEASAGWPGGERNKTLLGNKLNELGLLDAEDKVAAMQQAYEALKADDLIEPARPRGADGRYTSAAAPAAFDRFSPQEILEAYKNGRDPQTVNAEFSTLFGRH